jgi:hypothetical protein
MRPLGPLVRPILAGTAGALLLLGCSAYPRAVEGVPVGESWVALPLRSWLAEGRAEPQAVAICRPPDCGPGLVVSVLHLAGEDARTAGALLRNPEPLARALEKPKPTSTVRTLAAVERLRAGRDRGFLLRLERADGGKRPAFGAALGREVEGALRLVFVVGDDGAAVEETVRRVAAEHLGP